MAFLTTTKVTQDVHALKGFNKDEIAQPEKK